ncbi:MAG: GntR family transcriptional regulator [Anaerolinea sp.]|nr:GntR family transcriptional regulator [Anaerolinea sp.]
MANVGTVKAPLNTLRFVVEMDSPIPYYIQVKEALHGAIDQRVWLPGSQIPGEPELCRVFNVSRTVIRQALSEMEHEGVIVRRKGKGTFVAEPKIVESLVQKLTGFYQDMVERGHTPVTQVLKQQVIPASSKVAKRLSIPPETQVIEMERLRFVDDEPILLVTTYLPYDRCAPAADADFTGQSLYTFLEKECGLMITSGSRWLEAVLANEYEAQQLKVKAGAPLILIDSIAYLEDGTPIEYYHAVHRGDRSRFEVKLVRVRERASARESASTTDDLPTSH